jgi:hypothetical protein
MLLELYLQITGVLKFVHATFLILRSKDLTCYTFLPFVVTLLLSMFDSSNPIQRGSNLHDLVNAEWHRYPHLF